MEPRIDQEPVAVQLWRSRAWVLPGLLIAVVAVLLTSYRVQLLPPALERDSAEFASATTSVFVDFPHESALYDVDLYMGPLVERANAYARIASSPAFLERIARRADVNPAEIDARGPYNPNTERILQEPTAERRALQLQAEDRLYRLRLDAQPNQGVPIVQIYAQAPTVETATRLADASADVLRAYVRRIQKERSLKDGAEVKLEQLGKAEGAITNPGVDRQIAVLVFSAALLAWFLLVLAIFTLRRSLATRGHFSAAAR